MKKVLVRGATGQIGSELTPVLHQDLGFNNVIVTDYKERGFNKFLKFGVGLLFHRNVNKIGA